MFRVILCLIFTMQCFCEELDVVKVSEAIGHLIGKNLNSLGIDVDLDAIVKGLKDEQSGKNAPLNEDECIQAIANLQEEKISSLSEQELENLDNLSNGDEIQENEDHTVPATDSAKYR